jgi:AcrR family transcriptional regulator
MPGDAEATKRRLLAAARKEFGAYGIAGARVDRIAAEAGSNKAQIYHYFGSKHGLFDAVFDEMVAQTLASIPIHAADLPEYAARLFDHYEEHPEVKRLATWYQLERASTDAPLERITYSNRYKIEAIARAQRKGLVPPKYEPVVLLGLISQLAGFWAGMTPEYGALVDRALSDGRRKVVTDAVAALLRD